MYGSWGIDFKPKWAPAFLYLADGKGHSMSSIAKDLGQTHVAVSYVLKEMKEQGLVSLRKGKGDARCTEAALTAKGQRCRRLLDGHYQDTEAAALEINSQSLADLLVAVREWEYKLDQKSLKQRTDEAEMIRLGSGIVIAPFDAGKDQRIVEDFVLGIQNGEYGLVFSLDDEPDMMDIALSYKDGGFWTAKTADGELVGTIGLQLLANNNAVLRKMFVKKSLRGSKLRLAQKLYDVLMDAAAASSIHTIWLDTPPMLHAAHHFYHRNGFVEVRRDEIPADYRFPDRDSLIFKKQIK